MINFKSFYGFVPRNYQPNSLSKILNLLYLEYKILQARLAFMRAKPEPTWLGRKEFERLYRKSYKVKTMKYSEESRNLRAKNRAKMTYKMLTPKIMKNIKTMLELGCYDGIVCSEFQKLGKKTTVLETVVVFCLFLLWFYFKFLGFSFFYFRQTNS